MSRPPVALIELGDDGRPTSRVPEAGADDTVETEGLPFGVGFEGLAASLSAPKRPNERELERLLARRDRSAVTTLPGLQTPPPASPQTLVRSTHVDALSQPSQTQPFDRKLLAGHATVFEKMPTVIVGDSAQPEADRTQPSSIAPFAIDLSDSPEPDRPLSADLGAMSSESDGDVPPAGHRRGDRPTVRIFRGGDHGSFARLAAGAAALVVGGLLAFFALRPAPAPETTNVASVTTLTAAESAPPPVVRDEPRPEPGLVPVTGTIILHKATGVLLVDGERKHIDAGQVVVTCGKHRLGTGRKAQTVVVPCGGTLTR